jgi:8-oxo-dGTP pyrophosphatase MutT (NUDIX family)
VVDPAGAAHEPGDDVRRVPQALRKHVMEYLSGEREPTTPRGAATVVLLHDGSAGLEVYLLRRHLAMAFAAGMYAFPGGTVDARDFDSTVAWAGPSPEQWALRLDCDPAEARALVCAATRETFEEAGVLLAGSTAETLVADTTGDDWELDRSALVDRRLSFTDFLRRRGLVLRTDLLAAWAHWITPEFEPRRYDTRFFLAKMPTGQRTRDVSGEADHVAWMRPSDALAAVAAQEMQMLAPTFVTLTEMAEYASTRDALGAADSRVITTITPGVQRVGDELFFTHMEGQQP